MSGGRRRERFPTSTAAGYHSPEALDAALDAAVARAGSRVVDEVVGRSVEGRPIRALTFAAPGAVPDASRPQAVVTANIHGVEVISSEVALGVVERLADPAPGSRAAELLAAADVTVVPVVNVDGRTRSVESLGRRGWFEPAPRRNARGVDLNRNWPWPPGARAHWLPIAGTTIGWLPWNRGPSPLSEPETAALAGLFERFRPYAAAHLHSTGRIVTYPWSCRPDPPADLDRFEQMTDALTRAQPRWRYRCKQSNAWYPIVGSLNDYLYATYGTLSITVEIGTTAEALRADWRRARWWFWSANPADPAPHVDNDADACLAGLAAVAPEPGA